jgi:hypothetical protein
MLLTTWVIMAWLAAPPLPTMRVCELLGDDPTKLNGKTVKVRGLLTASDEGIWLLGECKTHLVTKGFIWANHLSVYVEVFNEATARSWDEMNLKLRRLHADASKDRIWVTLVGRIETRQSMDDEVIGTPPGPVRPIGFGHLNGAPAEINVISVEDVTLEPLKGTQR